jgi:transposase InsO family protein
LTTEERERLKEPSGWLRRELNRSWGAEETRTITRWLAESVIGLFKTEVIRRRGPWPGLEDVEFATLEWVAWFNHSRLLEPIGYVPPAEHGEAYNRRQPAPAALPALT